VHTSKIGGGNMGWAAAIGAIAQVAGSAMSASKSKGGGGGPTSHDYEEASELGAITSRLNSAWNNLTQMSISDLSARTSLATAKKAPPGGGKLAGALSNYLFERVGEGLTEEEEDLYMGEGKTAIQQAVRAASKSTQKNAAAQGLRGGAVSNALQQIQQSSIPATAQLSTDLAKLDIGAKNQIIQSILAYLGLDIGMTEEQVADAKKSIGGSFLYDYPGRNVANYHIPGVQELISGNYSTTVPKSSSSRGSGSGINAGTNIYSSKGSNPWSPNSWTIAHPNW
jgi:hypothetical protein